MGLRRIVLEQPWAYESAMKIFGSKESLTWIVDQLIVAVAGERVLDLGCGTAKIFSAMNNVEYIGIDNNSKYIQTALKRHGQFGDFICADLNAEIVESLGTFDKILLLGVMHHLPSKDIQQLMALVPKLLKPHGALLTMDPALEKNQHPISRILVRLDRGRFVRSSDDYAALIKPNLTIIEQTIRHDLNRMPYTHAIIKAKRTI